jgi:hypothetical protein
MTDEETQTMEHEITGPQQGPLTKSADRGPSAGFHARLPFAHWVARKIRCRAPRLARTLSPALGREDVPQEGVDVKML